MSDLTAITWLVARTGGLVAFGLVTASVVIGLILSLKLRSQGWPRFVTNELHRFVTLLALVFVAIHTLAVAIDPFIKFSLSEVLVPLTSHYRPMWVAFGIIGAYVLVAVWLSEWVRPLIGYGWWRRFHALAFVAYVLSVVHGLATGSDSRAPWAIALYATSLVLVAALIGARLLPSGQGQRGHPVLAAMALVLMFDLLLWSYLGPLQPGWNVVANNGQGSGQILGP